MTFPRVARLLAAVMIVVATAVGTWSAAAVSPARPVEVRAGYRVLQGDFHAHTRFSDGVVSPCDLVLLGRERGLDVIAVTEHNRVFPAFIARACAGFIHDPPIVVIGEEITRRDLHLLALGVGRSVDARVPAKDLVAAIHAQGGVAIAAHPTRRFRPAVEPICDDLDGIEVVHPLAYRSSSVIGPWSDIAELARGDCGVDKAMLGNSDYHAGSVLGVVRTYVFVREPTEAGVIEAIRDRRTVTIAPDGSVFGPADLAASLQAEPLAPRPTDYGYGGAGPIDRITRALGLLGLVVLLVLSGGGRRTLAGC